MKTNILFFVLLSLSRVLCAEELVDDTEPGVYLSGIQAGREVDRWGDVLFAVATKDGDYPVILRSVVGKKGEQSSVSLRFTLRISKGGFEMRNGLTNRNAPVCEESVIAQSCGDRRTGDGGRGDGPESAGSLALQICTSAFLVGEDGRGE